MSLRSIINNLQSSWSPTAEYLSNKIPEKTFEIVPVDYDHIYSVVEKSEVDFILSNPSFYVELENRYGVNRIATLKNKVFPFNMITLFMILSI